MWHWLSVFVISVVGLLSGRVVIVVVCVWPLLARAHEADTTVVWLEGWMTISIELVETEHDTNSRSQNLRNVSVGTQYLIVPVIGLIT